MARVSVQCTGRGPGDTVLRCHTEVAWHGCQCSALAEGLEAGRAASPTVRAPGCEACVTAARVPSHLFGVCPRGVWRQVWRGLVRRGRLSRPRQGSGSCRYTWVQIERLGASAGVSQWMQRLASSPQGG
ncbi:hypothetical protein NDU88_000875 [Pleurodeles waltl]|uniref:Uncharacterized protein n=1 Tax=Pleurodeles waltl TaxID=8319 RepID=A0AAV7P2J8_PLEWA|nr:hypothetical protein NDU88_000875 [Pleurodeles waltl]